ncbi:MAG: hypothetical protein CMJ23_01565 [Phycisphaerae bacterium]|nr:hypothetical protein [Phycisphaerae bacterium]
MPLIKNNRARELVNGAVVMNLGDVRKEADGILDAARREAAGIVEAARIEAERLSSGAAERGYQEGRTLGEDEGRVAGREEGTLQGARVAEAAIAERLGGIADGWNQALDAYLAGREVLREESRRDLLRLSIAIAERILGRLPDHDPTLVIDQVEGAVEMLAGATRLRIQVHPDDLPIIEQHFREASSNILSARDSDIEFGTDEDIVRGGCVVSAGDGEVDARLDGQISRIVQGLFPELSETPEPPTVTEVSDAVGLDSDAVPVVDAPDHPMPVPPSVPTPAAGGESTATAGGDPAVDSWDDIVPAEENRSLEDPEAASE